MAGAPGSRAGWASWPVATRRSLNSSQNTEKDDRKKLLLSIRGNAAANGSCGWNTALPSIACKRMDETASAGSSTWLRVGREVPLLSASGATRELATQFDNAGNGGGGSGWRPELARYCAAGRVLPPRVPTRHLDLLSQSHRSAPKSFGCCAGCANSSSALRKRVLRVWQVDYAAPLRSRTSWMCSDGGYGRTTACASSVTSKSSVPSSGLVAHRLVAGRLHDIQETKPNQSRKLCATTAAASATRLRSVRGWPPGREGIGGKVYRIGGRFRHQIRRPTTRATQANLSSRGHPRTVRARPAGDQRMLKVQPGPNRCTAGSSFSTYNSNHGMCRLTQAASLTCRSLHRIRWHRASQHQTSLPRWRNRARTHRHVRGQTLDKRVAPWPAQQGCTGTSGSRRSELHSKASDCMQREVVVQARQPFRPTGRESVSGRFRSVKPGGEGRSSAFTEHRASPPPLKIRCA